MLFNSYEFLIFLAATFGAFVLARRLGRRAAAITLIVASLFFYSYWNPAYLPLLVASVLVDYYAGRLIARYRRRWLLACVIAVNLLVLGYFKYYRFLVINIAALFHADLAVPDIILPLGISFYIFQQISYQVDVYRGRVVSHSLINYASLVCFFPHLIAGPIVLQRDALNQFAGLRFSYGLRNFCLGMTIFAIGLFKKVVVADNIAAFATSAFDAADAGLTISPIEAWCGALAYTFQLYFDFSGYSDMAIGLGRLFGIRLPLNFFSPYKATSIVEFWRRWHMTLSGFLRDYLYLPLGGSRRGPARTLANVVVVMGLGGLWHGAGWNFPLWGLLHGVYLVTNHCWLMLAARSPVLAAMRRTIGWRIVAWTTTFLAVVCGWVLFRAHSLAGAGAMLDAMSVWRHQLLLPDIYLARLGVVGRFLADRGVGFVDVGTIGAFSGFKEVAALAAALVFVLVLPNTAELVADRPVGWLPSGARRVAWGWTLDWRWAAFAALLLFLALGSIDRPSEFLYFQF